MQSQGSKSAAATTGKQFYKGRRPRVPLSCDPCRSRKLKCNREQPCQNCITRNEDTTCKYRGSNNGPRSSAAPRYEFEHEHGHVDPMQQRIDHLESLVKTLMAKVQETAHVEDSTLPKNGLGSWEDTKLGIGPDRTSGTKDVPSAPSSTGKTVINGSQSVYKAANDWSDVLQEVNKLKKAWNQTQDDLTDDDMPRTLANMVDGSSFLSGQLKQVEISELLASLPPKSEVDNMISQFFDRENFPIPTAPILHEPTFMREYAEHWKDPSRTNAIWLGLLFSILGITMLSYHQFDNEPPEYKGSTETLFELYRLRTAQCLMIGDIAKCLPYTLETLLLNSTAELSRKDDSYRGLWMMTGIIVRAAINMGYHREPSSSVSVLQGELRRRVWLAVESKDDLASFLVGFPSMMLAIFSDTSEPRNLHDWELSANTTVLPPSRPLSEITPVTYIIVKGRLVRALGRITDFNNAVGPGSYDKLLEIDRSLHEVYENILPQMKSDVGSADSDSSQSKSATDVSIIQMEFLYHRGMCDLHRRLLAKARGDHKYNLSRDRCISSALAILTQQHFFHQQTKSKSPSYVPYWYKVAQARQFFILAAMIVCLELEHRRRGTDKDMAPGWDVLVNALERSCTIWRDVQSTSDEAWRAYHVLTSMLLSFKPTAGSTTNNSSQTLSSELVFTFPEVNQPIQSTDSTFLFEEDIFEKSNEMDIDWATWDSFIEGASFEEAYQGILFNVADTSASYATL